MYKRKLLSIFLVFTFFFASIQADSVFAQTNSILASDITTTGNRSKTTPTGLTAIEYTNDIYQVNLSSLKTKSASEQTSEWNQYSNCYFYNLITDAQQVFYDSLYTMCLDYLENNTAISGSFTAFCNYTNLTSDEAAHIATIFFYANPQFYYLQKSYVYSVASDNNSGSFAFMVYEAFRSSSDRAAATAEFKAGINSYLEIIDANDTAYEMELKLHDAIIQKTSYVMGDYDQSTYSVFVQNATVCAGYAGAYSMLLNAVGIEAISLTSTGHQWNYVRLNDTWYIVDTTWDDFGESSSYDCFNRSTEGMATISTEGVHTPNPAIWDDYFIPVCAVDSGSTFSKPASEPYVPSKTADTPLANVSVKNGVSTVALSSTLENAQIFYTTDGSTPSVASTKSHLYNEAFTMSETATLKAITVCATYYDSKAVTINVKSAVTPVITKQPVSATYTFKDSASKLTVSATAFDNGKLTYQWYKSSSKTTVGSVIKSATSASYTPKTATIGTSYYYCKITNTQNGTSQIVNSSYAKIVVNKQSLSSVKITGLSAKTYTGSAIKPSFTVKLGSTKLTAGTDYSVSYKNNKSIGTATITITGIGNYKGTTTSTFFINPKKTTLNSLSAGSKNMTVKWSKVSNATGYQIQTSTSKSFTSVKTTTVTKNTTLSKTMTSLSSGKTYYVRVRTYKTVNGKRYYSAWSTIKSTKVK